MFELKMKKGKFKGKTMEEIPSGYLLWIAENFDNEELCFAADTEWREREKWNNHWEFYD